MAQPGKLRPDTVFDVWSAGSGRMSMRQRIDMVAKWAEKGSTQSGGEAFSLGFVMWR